MVTKMISITTRFPWTSCVIICRHSSSSRRNTTEKNHYENLGVQSDATHNEIKSAYFQLSKQYHPDMNKSAEAKLKFNDIASAYEVLGNHAKRRHYDRGLRISITPDERDVIKKEQEFGDLHEEARRVYTAIQRNRTQADGTPIFDFDTWTEKHYGRAFERRREELLRAREFSNRRNERKRGKVPWFLEVQIIAGSFLAIYTLARLSTELANWDDDSVISSDQNVVEVKVDIAK